MRVITYEKKAISTVVGGMIFLIIMAGALAAMIGAIQLQNNLTETTINISTNEIGKIQEEFAASADVKNNLLSVTVANTGSVPLEIADLWMINKSQSDGGIKLVDIKFDDGLIPFGHSVDILDGETTGIKDGIYDLKLVSARGNMQIIRDFTVTNGGLGGTDCEVKAYVVPPNIAAAGNATLIMQVFNQGTNTIFDLEPDGDPIVTPPSAVLGKKLTTPSSINELKGGESFLFAWNYKLTGTIGSIVKFDVSAHGKTVDDGPIFDVQCNSSETITEIVKTEKDETVSKKLEASADIFLVFPNPAGQSRTSESLGWWNVIVVNPTNQTMHVNRVVIQAISQPTSNVKIFQSGKKLVPYEPTGTGGTQGTWSVPEDNVLVWQINSITGGQGLAIPPVSARQFAAKSETGSLTTSALFTIAVGVYTSFGEFSNIGHTSFSRKFAEGTTIVNIFPVNVTSLGRKPISGFSDDDAAVDNRINSVLTLTQSGTTPASGTAYFVLREGQDSGSSADYIPRGRATMIINFPPGFTIGSIPAQNNFGTPTKVGFSDGTQQIRVSTSADLGRDGPGATGDTDAQRFLFQIPFTAPLVEDDRLYIIYSFVTGFDSNGNHLGAVSEAFVIKVDVP